MNFAIRYLTEYHYKGKVADNLNALRVRPATTSTQRVDDFHVRVDPEARLQRHLDYYGTEVIEFGVAQPHDHLSIDVRARVVTAEPGDPPDEGWEALEAGSYEAAGGEFLLSDDAEPENGALDELFDASRATSPLATLRLLCELVPDRFEYRKGATYVGSTIQDLLDAGAGVCQDFVHLGLVLLRRHGIAARYVSGYLFAPPGDDESADSAEVDTHAWIEALLPAEGDGEPVWMPADPTNRILADERHVKIGHGRHYSDVPPIKGVFRGTAKAELEASVRMQRTDATSTRA
jgi:transglutaminase-like putative cysteine protease